MNWYVYIVECRDKSFYTGMTTDIERRLKEHNSKAGAKSIMGKLPVTLVYFEEFQTQSEARKREASIKKWTREYKLKLINSKRSRVYP